MYVQRPRAEQESQESKEPDPRSYPSKDMGGATGKLLETGTPADAPLKATEKPRDMKVDGPVVKWA